MLCLAVCQELISQRFINSLQPVNDFSAAIQPPCNLMKARRKSLYIPLVTSFPFWTLRAVLSLQKEKGGLQQLQNFLLQLIFINILPDDNWPKAGWCQNLCAVPQRGAGAVG